MRRDSKIDPFENAVGAARKRIARDRYADRQIEKWYMWSFETFGKIKYKELMKTIDTFTLTNQ
jgi:hypothetical protein